MVDYDLALCYGIIVSNDKIKKIMEALTDAEYDEMIDNYARCVNSWTGNDFFIGVIKNLYLTDPNLIYYVSDLFTPTDKDENLISFMQFCNEHDLWKFIDWKPELMLINFCY